MRPDFVTAERLAREALPETWPRLVRATGRDVQRRLAAVLGFVEGVRLAVARGAETGGTRLQSDVLRLTQEVQGLGREDAPAVRAEFSALSGILRESPLRLPWLLEVIDGAVLERGRLRYRDWAQFAQFARTGFTVPLLMAASLVAAGDVEEESLGAAGEAFARTWALGSVGRELDRGRVLLPESFLAECEVSREDLAARTATASFQAMVALVAASVREKAALAGPAIEALGDAGLQRVAAQRLAEAVDEAEACARQPERCFATAEEKPAGSWLRWLGLGGGG